MQKLPSFKRIPIKYLYLRKLKELQTPSQPLSEWRVHRLIMRIKW